MSFFNKQDLVQKFAQGGFVRGEQHFSTLLESQSTSTTYDIFLSHSFLNATQVYILKKEIENFGFSVYVDWIEDKQLSRNNVNKNTARILRERMKQCNCLLYAYTFESVTSKWMPWELGFFDGIKERVAILPIEERETGSNTFKGQEYLGIYPYITKQKDKQEINSLWVNEGSPDVYVNFESWLNGKKPYKRS
jgi:hypothetical protein